MRAESRAFPFSRFSVERRERREKERLVKDLSRDLSFEGEKVTEGKGRLYGAAKAEAGRQTGRQAGIDRQKAGQRSSYTDLITNMCVPWSLDGQSLGLTRGGS